MTPKGSRYFRYRSLRTEAAPRQTRIAEPRQSGRMASGSPPIRPEGFLMSGQEALQVLAERKPDDHLPAEAQNETERLD